MTTELVINFVRGTHEEYKDIEGLDMNYVTCGSEQEAMNYIYKFEDKDKDKIIDHVRITKGVYGEDVYYVYYKYKEDNTKIMQVFEEEP